MTTPHDPRDHNPPPRGDNPTAGSLRCPECGEAARPVPPTEWPLAGFAARPGASHLDGSPLCPVYGDGGVRPAEPVGVPVRLTMWQAVRQNALARPDWTVEEHLAWLDSEGYATTRGDDPAEVVGRWLTEHRRASTLSVPATDPRVYVVGGGDMVAVFDDPDAAGMQQAVMEAAGLDTGAYTLSTSQWEQVRPLLKKVAPSLAITDVRDVRTGPTA